MTTPTSDASADWDIRATYYFANIVVDIMWTGQQYAATSDSEVLCYFVRMPSMDEVRQSLVDGGYEVE